MSDIFRVNQNDGIKITGGVQRDGYCSNVDPREVGRRTELETGGQNGGGNTPFGLVQYIYVTGCLRGSGTFLSPVYIDLNPTGGIYCGASGLYIEQSTVYVGGCLSGSGTADNPIVITLNPTGGLHCTASGLAVNMDFISSVYTSGCIVGSGTVDNPVRVLLNPTGGISCGESGLYISTAPISSVYVTGCLTGSGTIGNPVSIRLSPSGGIFCGPEGLYVLNTATGSECCTAWSYESGNAPLSPTSPTTPMTSPESGNIQVEVYDNLLRFWFYNGSGFTLDKEFAPINSVVTSGCIGGSGTSASPIYVRLNPTGNINCTASGLAVSIPTPTGLNNVSTVGCLSGNGTAGSPLTVLLNSTGNVYCTTSGLAVQFPEVNASVAGCLQGNGSPGSPLAITLNPTGGIACGPNGLYVTTSVTGVTNTSVYTDGCLSGSGILGDPITIRLSPSGNIYCGPDGLYVLTPTGEGCCTAWSYESGNAPLGPSTPTTPMTSPSSGNIQVEVYDDMLRFWFYNGSGFTLDKEFTLPTATGLNNVSTVGCLSGNGTAGSPLTVSLNPTGNVYCTSSGLAVQFPEVNASVAGCLQGNGSPGSPLAITINPTGGIHCTPAGLAVNGLTSVYVTGCLEGVGTLASPISIKLSPSGNIYCGPDGLYTLAATGDAGCCTAWSYESGNAPTSPTQPTTPLTNLESGNVQVEVYDDVIRFWFYDGSFVLDKEFSGGSSTVTTSGCASGTGAPGSPITVLLNPTGNVRCTPSGLSVQFPEVNASVAGCLEGNGSPGSPLAITLNPTGGIHCTPLGLAVNIALASSGGCCTAWSYESGNAPLSPVSPTSPLSNLESGNVQVEVFDNMIRFWFHNGSTFILDKEFSGGGGSGISYVSTTGCLEGSGTPASPLSVKLDPAGYIYCGVDGLYVSGLSTGGCCTAWSYESGNAPLSPTQPTTPLTNLTSGNIQVEVYSDVMRFWFHNGVTFILDREFSGGGVGTSGITSVVTSGCLSGSGVTGSPLRVLLNPTGNIYCTTSGLAVQFPEVNASVAGCLQGNGSPGSPLAITLNPTGGLQCTAAGLAINASLSGSGLSSVTTSGCISGSGTPSSPVVIVIDPTGYLACGQNGLRAALPDLYIGTCLSGNGSEVAPLNVLLNPTGGLQCTSTGLAVQFPSSTGLNNVSTSGCLAGNGTADSRLYVMLNPTGNVYCTNSGLAVQFPEVNASVAGCLQGNGSPGSPLAITLNPTGGIQCTAGGLAINATLGGSPSSPVNAVQYNNGGSFGGSSGLMWDNSASRLSVSGFLTVSGSSPSGASSPALTIAQTWNNSSVNFTGVYADFNIVNAASSSNLVEFKVNGTSYFSVSRFGDTRGEQFTTNAFGARLANASLRMASGNIIGFTPTTTSIGSFDLELARGGVDTLAIRRGNNPSALHVYDAWFNASNYSRGVMSFNGSPGVLQIGAEHAGSGVPMGVQILTSGAPRIEIFANGSVQFNQSYTFPNTDGASGQVLTTNGSSIVSWATPAGGSDYFIGETDNGNSSSGITINFTSKANHKLTLTGNCTLSFTPPASARETKIRFVQGGSGAYSITLPSGTLGSTPILSSGVGDQTVVNFYYDGDGNWHV